MKLCITTIHSVGNNFSWVDNFCEHKLNIGEDFLPHITLLMKDSSEKMEFEP